MKILEFQIYNVFKKLICHLDRTYITVPYLHKSFVVLLYYSLSAIYTKTIPWYAWKLCMKTVDLSGLYYYHIYNTQITYLDGYCSIHYPLWVSVIETLLKCICVLFLLPWVVKYLKQSLDELWVTAFGFLVFIRIPLALSTLPDDDGSLPS